MMRGVVVPSCFIGLLAQCFVSSALGGAVGNPLVLPLVMSNFTDYVHPKESVVVEFYAPWCGHCKKLTPEYARAAEAFAGRVPFVAVDATLPENKELQNAYVKEGFPTLRVFKNGVPTEEYRGDLTADPIITWAQERAMPTVRELKTEQEVSGFLDEAKQLRSDDSNPRSFVFAKFNLAGAGPSGLLDAYKRAAEQLKSAKAVFGLADAAGGPNRVEVIRGTQGLAKAFEGDQQIQPDTLNVTLASVLCPDLPEINGNTAPLFEPTGVCRISAPGKVVLLAKFPQGRAVEAVEPYRFLMNQLRARFKGRFNFAYMDTFAGRGTLQRIYRLDYHADIPTLYAELKGRTYIFQNSEALCPNQFIPSLVWDLLPPNLLQLLCGIPAFTGESAVAKWLESVEKGTAKRFAVSQPGPVPKYNKKAPVNEVVGANFEERLLNQKKDIFFRVYAPWCEYSKKMAPTFQALGTETVSDPDLGEVLEVLEMDGTKNEAIDDGFPSIGYPTVWFMPAGATKPIEFSGPKGRITDYFDFAQLHSTNQEALAVYKRLSPSDEEEEDIVVPEQPAGEAAAEEPGQAKEEL